MTPVYIPLWIREVVIRRADGCCEYCRTPAAYSPEIFEFDHTQPGQSDQAPSPAFLAWSCPACNRYKGARTTAADPETTEDAPLFNPREHQWPEQFAWSQDLLYIEGLTSTGRATVDALRMNRPAIVKFRLALKSIHQHPAQLAA